MKMSRHLLRFSAPVSLRNAWLINRACKQNDPDLERIRKPVGSGRVEGTTAVLYIRGQQYRWDVGGPSEGTSAG